MQLISEFEQIFSAANLSLWLRPYRVLATDPNSGLIELVPSVMSIHALKDR
jgi:phosphatidylinositol kinase/protein kinase (PI-3  family)